MNILKTLNEKLFTVKTNYNKQRLFPQNHVLSQNIYQNRDNIEIVDNHHILISAENVYEYTQQITENCILDFVNKVNSRKKVNAKIIIKQDYNISKIDYSIYDEQLKNKNLYFCIDQEKSPLYFMIGNYFFMQNKIVNKNIVKNFEMLNKRNFKGFPEFKFVDFNIIYE